MPSHQAPEGLPSVETRPVKRSGIVSANDRDAAKTTVRLPRIAAPRIIDDLHAQAATLLDDLIMK
jgi:hypothetical protein